MSVVDDVRKLIQDLVTPELRAQGVRLDHIEKRLDNVEKRLDSLREDIRTQVQSVVVQITGYLRLDQRLTTLEDREQRKELPDRGQQ